jgi:hypothetical protein
MGFALEEATEQTPTPFVWLSGRQRASGSHVEGQEVARTEKIAARQGRVIVIIDESGLSERHCRARTRAPKGQTPVLPYSFSWKQLSVMAGLSYWRFYFRLFVLATSAM